LLGWLALAGIRLRILSNLQLCVPYRRTSIRPWSTAMHRR
jgi:hypothetical protein